MKKYQFNLMTLVAVMFSLALISISGCSYAFNGVKGNGNVIKQERNVSDFTGIDVGGAFHIFLTQGSEVKVVVEADENLMDIIETEVHGNTLKISTSDDIRESKEMNVYITFKSLDDMDFSGACKVESTGKLTFDELDLECSGASDVMLTFAAKELELDCSGASQVELLGSAREVNLDLSGASKLDALELEVEEMDADVSGASSGKVMVSSELSADVSGASSFRYKGEPKIGDVDVSGAASLKKY